MRVYGRYDESSQLMGLFTSHLQDCKVVAQYMMSSTLKQNGVAGKRNRTLIDMIKHDENMSFTNLFGVKP